MGIRETGIKTVRGFLDRQGLTPEVIQQQKDAVCENIGAHSFEISFKFERVELNRMHDPQFREFREQHERFARFSQFITDSDIETSGMGGARYYVVIRISPGEALRLLENCGVTVTWAVSNQFGKTGSPPDPAAGARARLYFRQEQQSMNGYHYPPVDYSKYSVEPESRLENMSSADQNLTRECLMHRHLSRADVQISHEFQVKSRYLDGEVANPDDFYTLRRIIWHEIMETVLILIGTEAFCYPLDMHHSLNQGQDPDTGEIRNFAHDAVKVVQNYVMNNRNLWLYWPGDPPFDGFEVGAYTREAEARRLEEVASRLEWSGNWAGAAQAWQEAEDAWERALEAWEAVPRYPGRSDRIDDAKAKLAEIRKRKGAALWKAASWDASRTSRNEISIRYSSWPERFKARIVDAKAGVRQSFDKLGGSGVITWGKDAKAGVYFIKVEAKRVESTVKKVVIP